MSSIGDKLVQYCDAYYPIVYIDTYEDAKTDSIISEAFKRGYTVEEWNGATGHCDFKNKNSFFDKPKPLEDTLRDLLVQRKLNKKILVLKDISEYFKQPNIVALLKQIAYKISTGCFESSMIIIVSPVVVIPSELEKYITVINQEYLEYNDITRLINDFIAEQGAKPVSSELNLCNYSTIEFRIFRGTLKYNTIIATLQLVAHICIMAANMTDEEFTALSWPEFVSTITEPELITYLKERRLYINEPINEEEDD